MESRHLGRVKAVVACRGSLVCATKRCVEVKNKKQKIDACRSFYIKIPDELYVC